MAPSLAMAGEPAEPAAGWLRLERHQRTYRARVEPLDLREERELEVIERGQRLDLRAIDQASDRARNQARRAERFDRPPGPGPVQAPRFGPEVDRDRRYQRSDNRLRTQQGLLPFRRR